MFAILMASLLQTQPCTTLDQCYIQAGQKVERVLTVQYEDVEITQTATSVDCQGLYVSCQDLGEAVALRSQRATWNSVSGISGQGFISEQNGRFTGYSGLRPLERMPLNLSGVGPAGFTIALTFSLTNPIHSQRIVSLLDENGNVAYAVDWTQGYYRGPYFMWLRRWATTGSGDDILLEDRPWDYHSDTVTRGPREFQARPSPADLFELYLTFRPDGKVEADWFSISNTSRDFLISHLQDSGVPVITYPTQPEQGAWSAPSYRNFRTLVVGANQQSDVPILQAVHFREALTMNQRIAFHSRNLFYNMQGKEGTAHLAPDQRPCNSGWFLQTLENETFETVCGPRHGLRASPTGGAAAAFDE
ncbi:MAG: hypothetical protein KKA16_00550 [Alphaproteobacteria bacterium]|nr:hypothetical protein [Alphaproteobacteria bacterium]MBU2379338.1 hypothetical protein [Alphaproteobacteria bacterium]